MREFSSRHAKECLQAMGFDVRDIPTVVGDKRADLFATYKNEIFIVEAKLREPHSEWMGLLQDIRSNDLKTLSRPVKPWSALSSKLQGAYQQLLSTPAPIGAFRILWLVAPHDDADFVLECLKVRLLGRAKLTIIHDIHSLPAIKDCFHYHQSEFQRAPELDAVILTNQTSGQLLVNCYSENKVRPRTSHFYTTLQHANAVVDPEELNAQGSCFLIPTNYVGGHSDKSKWQYLKQTYGVMTSVMHESLFRGIVPINAQH